MMLEQLQFYFGLAPASDVYEKFDGDVAKIIIDERKIVFWRLGLPLGAMFGAFVMFLLILFAQVMRFINV